MGNLSNMTTTRQEENTYVIRHSVGIGIFALLMALIIILSILEMVFVCYVIHKNNLIRIKVWFYLYILTISDTGLALFAAPTIIAACFDETIMTIPWIRYVNGFSMMFFGTWSTLTLAAISLQKYFTVSNPLSTSDSKERWLNVLYFVVTFVICFGFAVSPICGFSTYSYMKYRKWSVPFRSSNLKNDKSLSLLVAIFAYLVPICAIVVSSLGIYAFVRKQATKREKMGVKSKGKSGEAIILNTLLLVIIAFFVSWTPLMLLAILGMARVQLPIWFSYVTYLLMFVKGPVNPFIYCNRHKAFKKEFSRFRPKLPFSSLSKIKQNPYKDMVGGAPTKTTEANQIESSFMEGKTKTNPEEYIPID